MSRPRLRIPHAEREEGEVVVCEVEAAPVSRFCAVLWGLVVFRQWMWLDHRQIMALGCLIDKFTNVELL